jgi:hypothetical protein
MMTGCILVFVVVVVITIFIDTFVGTTAIAAEAIIFRMVSLSLSKICATFTVLQGRICRTLVHCMNEASAQYGLQIFGREMMMFQSTLDTEMRMEKKSMVVSYCEAYSSRNKQLVKFAICHNKGLCGPPFYALDEASLARSDDSPRKCRVTSKVVNGNALVKLRKVTLALVNYIGPRHQKFRRSSFEDLVPSVRSVVHVNDPVTASCRRHPQQQSLGVMTRFHPLERPRETANPLLVVAIPVQVAVELKSRR